MIINETPSSLLQFYFQVHLKTREQKKSVHEKYWYWMFSYTSLCFFSKWLQMGFVGSVLLLIRGKKISGIYTEVFFIPITHHFLQDRNISCEVECHTRYDLWRCTSPFKSNKSLLNASQTVENHYKYFHWTLHSFCAWVFLHQLQVTTFPAVRNSLH